MCSLTCCIVASFLFLLLSCSVDEVQQFGKETQGSRRLAGGRQKMGGMGLAIQEAGAYQALNTAFEGIGEANERSSFLGKGVWGIACQV